MSDEAETPIRFPKVKFTDLYPGERFSYDKTNDDQDMHTFMKVCDDGAVDLDLTNIRLTFSDLEKAAEVYAIDRDVL